MNNKLNQNGYVGEYKIIYEDEIISSNLKHTFINCPTHKIAVELRGYNVNAFQIAEVYICPIDDEILNNN